MLAQSHKKLKELSVLVLDHDQVRAKTVCAELEEANFDTTYGVTDFENILHLLEEYKPNVLIIIADQITSAIEAHLKTIDQYISFPVILYLQNEVNSDVRNRLLASVSVYLAGEVNIKRMPSIVMTAQSRYQLEIERRSKVEKLEQQLSDRKLIEQAKGLLMMKKNLTESEAYRHLRDSAMRQNKTMAELSKSVIDVFQMID